MDHRERHARLSSLFTEACNLSEPHRSEFIRRECADDDALRAELEELLARDAKPAFVDDPVLPTAMGPGFILAAVEVAVSHPKTIGPYPILGVLGSGAMGIVYEAVQPSTGRAIALKVLPPGRATEDRLELFRQEVQALARCQHIGIAQIFDAGTEVTDQGLRSYIAMERVRGIPPTKYKTQAKLDIRDCLQLIRKICGAVQHAHERDVVHRDLKPSNILVNDQGHPKVLDFGIAHLVGDEATRKDGKTLSPIGTPAYMSPEQAQRQSEVGVQSDVYSLGVIAYELLSGQHPVRLKDGRTSASEVMQAIVEEQPVPLGSLARRLRGDVEAIVAKAMEKDAARRYRSASEFAADIGRFLDRFPVSARRPTPAYRFLRLTQRRPAMVAAFVILIIGLVSTSASLYRATRAEAQQRNLAQSEKIAKQEAVARARTTGEVLQFMDDVVFGAADPYRRLGPDYTARQMVLEAASDVDKRIADPVVAAMIRQSLGRLLRKLGDAVTAEGHVRTAVELLEGACGRDSSEALVARSELASVLDELGNPAAEQLLTETLSAMRSRFGDGNRDTLKAAGNTAIHFLRKKNPAEALKILSWLGDAQLAAFGAKDPVYLNTRGLEASALGDLDDPTADSHYVKAIEAYDASGLGDTFPPRLTLLYRYARYLHGKARAAEAEEVIRAVIANRETVLAPGHSALIQSKEVLVLCLESQAEYAGAAAVLTGVLDSRRHAGESEDSLLALRARLAALYERADNFESAEVTIETVYDDARRIKGTSDPFTVGSAILLASVMESQSRHTDAEKVLRTSLTELSDPKDEVLKSRLINALIDVYTSWERPEEAARWRSALPGKHK